MDSIVRQPDDSGSKTNTSQKELTPTERRLGRGQAARMQQLGVTIETIDSHRLSHNDLGRLAECAKNEADAAALLSSLTAMKTANSEIPQEAINLLVLADPAKAGERFETAKTLAASHAGLSVGDAIRIAVKSPDYENLLKAAEKHPAFRKLPEDRPLFYGVLAKQCGKSSKKSAKTASGEEWEALFDKAEASRTDGSHDSFRSFLAVFAETEAVSLNDTYDVKKTDIRDKLSQIDAKSREYLKWNVSSLKMLAFRAPAEFEKRVEVANLIEEKHPEISPSEAIQLVTFCSDYAQLEKAAEILADLKQNPPTGVKLYSTDLIQMANTVVKGGTREEFLARLQEKKTEKKEEKKRERAEEKRLKREAREAHEALLKVSVDAHATEAPKPQAETAKPAEAAANPLDAMGRAFSGLGTLANVPVGVVIEFARSVGKAFNDFANGLEKTGVSPPAPPAATPSAERKALQAKEEKMPEAIEPFVAPEKWVGVPEAANPEWFKQNSESGRGKALKESAQAIVNELGGFDQPAELHARLITRLSDLGWTEEALGSVDEELNIKQNFGAGDARDRLMVLAKCAVFSDAIGTKGVTAFASVLKEVTVERTEADESKRTVSPVSRLLSDDVLENHSWAARLQLPTAHSWLRAKAVTGSKDVTADAVRTFVNDESKQKKQSRFDGFSLNIPGSGDPLGRAFFDYVSSHPESVAAFEEIKYPHPEGPAAVAAGFRLRAKVGFLVGG